MYRLGLALVFTIIGPNALAEVRVWKTPEAQSRYIQMVSDDHVLLCQPGGFIGSDCIRLPATKNGGMLEFEKRPFKFSVSTDGQLKLENVIRETVEQLQLEEIQPQLSAARYSGNWGTANSSDVQIVKLAKDGKSGTMTYRFLKNKGPMNFKVVGSTLINEFPQGTFYFFQTPDFIYGTLYRDDMPQPAQVLMKPDPYKFSNDAACAQSYLNHLGFDVGKADGKPGPKSRRGSEAYLAAKAGVDLEPFTPKNATAWCKMLMESTPDNPGVVALAGF